MRQVVLLAFRVFPKIEKQRGLPNVGQPAGRCRACSTQGFLWGDKAEWKPLKLFRKPRGGTYTTLHKKSKKESNVPGGRTKKMWESVQHGTVQERLARAAEVSELPTTPASRYSIALPRPSQV